MTRPLFEDLLARSLAQIPEMETRILADEVARLRARVAELGAEVNLLHRQRHAAQEDAANARLLAEARQLSQGEIDRLRARVAELEARNAEWETFRAAFQDLTYHHQGMGCGIEDRGIHDRYQACEHGWDCAMERVAEQMPEEVGATPAPAPDVVTVPGEDWNVAASLANAWIRFPLVSEFAQNLKAWKALRSGEAGKGGT